MKKIRRGDDIFVIAGRDKGKQGKVLSVFSDNRLLISGINIVKKHKKPNPAKGESGGIIEKEVPIQLSNIAIYNPETNKGDRVGFAFSNDGEKYRIFRSSGKRIDS